MTLFFIAVLLLFVARFILWEIRNAPLMPDCYGLDGCFCDCDLCKKLRPDVWRKAFDNALV